MSLQSFTRVTLFVVVYGIPVYINRKVCHYFARPYFSWVRVANDYTNKLIRRFFFRCKRFEFTLWNISFVISRRKQWSFATFASWNPNKLLRRFPLLYFITISEHDLNAAQQKLNKHLGKVLEFRISEETLGIEYLW